MDNRTSRRDFLKTLTVFAGCAGLGFGCERGFPGRLSAEPRKIRGDEAFVVRVTDLRPGERVAVTAAFDDARGQEWSATALFEADGEGAVDTFRHAPVEGSYDVRDPMGLVWSALGPEPYIPPLEALTVRITARIGDGQASGEVRRYDAAGGVRNEDVRDEGLIGSFYSPSDEGSVPAVLVLGGSEGGLSPYVEREAALLASRGFAALSLAYFKGELFEPDDAEDLPGTLTGVPLEYFGRAIRWLAGRPAVSADRIGVLGTSRGGELALLLGAAYPDLKAVVSYVGSGVVVSSPGEDEAAWTRDGRPLPYLYFTGQDFSEIPPRDAKEAEIPVEKTNGPVLLIAAGDDAVWPSERLSRVAYERLGDSDRPYDDEITVYSEAGHAIGAPYVPTGYSAPRYGGTPGVDAAANEHSWRKVTAFLSEHLGR